MAKKKSGKKKGPTFNFGANLSAFTKPAKNPRKRSRKGGGS